MRRYVALYVCVRVCVRLSECLCVTSRCSVEIAGRMEVI